MGKMIEEPEVYEWTDKNEKTHIMCAIPVGEAGYGFSFGLTKAEAIVEHIDFIEKYVKDNSGRLPQEPLVYKADDEV